MNFSIVLNAFFLFSLSILIQQIDADKSCKEFIADAAGKTMKSFFECKTELKFTSEEDRVNRINCALVCAMKKQKFLTGEGFVDEMSILEFAQSEIPKDSQSRAVELMMQCQGATANLDPKEANCVSYNALLKCALNAVFKICN